MSSKAKGLGKGLSALIPQKSIEPVNETEKSHASADIAQSGIREIAITDVLPNPSQPRKNFTTEALIELTQSIKEHGVLQPLVVRELPTGKFEIIAGERRWRASGQAGLTKIPVVIKNLDDKDAMQVAIIENIQRQDLNAVEEAEAFQRLIQEFNMTQEEMGLRVGKSRSYITNSLRLLNLNKIVRSLVVEGKISAGHARALVTLEHEEQLKLAQRIIAENLSVRQVEKIINNKEKPKPLKTIKKQSDADMLSFENDLRTLFGTKVKNKALDKGGVIEIHYYDNEDLMRIADILLPNKD